jgi:ATP-dependent protease ClpP protease subunit
MEYLIELPKKKTQIWDNYVPILRSKDGKSTTIYLTEGFGEAGEYNEACHTMQTAKKGDTITLIICNGGGSTASAYYFIDSMKQSKATIVGHCTGFVASAATVVAMACSDLTVADNTNFMCHNYAHNAGGSGAQVKEYVDYIDREFRRATTEEYTGFLTDAEIALIVDHDKEVWLNAEDVRARWTTRQEFLSTGKLSKPKE